jgi:hypothetical protein
MDLHSAAFRYTTDRRLTPELHAMRRVDGDDAKPHRRGLNLAFQIAERRVSKVAPNK